MAALRELMPLYIEGKLIQQFMKSVLTVSKLRVSMKCDYPVFAIDTLVLNILSQSYENLKNMQPEYNTATVFLQVLLHFGNV